MIGKPVVSQLVEAGHEVTGTTRSRERAAEIESLGAVAAICDGLVPESVMSAVEAAAPEVVINQMTNLPREYNPKDPHFYDQTNRLRSAGGRNLIEAAQAAGVRRFVTQSIAFTYAAEGSWVKDEEAGITTGAPGHFGETYRVMAEHERDVLGAAGLEGLCLRYGFFYGPGTYYASDGALSEEIRKRRFPVVGAGTGTFSFVHTDDAASAAVCAIDHGAPGIYNVTDDEPAPVKDWLPVFARALGAKPPRHVPLWLAKLFAGKPVATSAVEMRGASNAKAKAGLGWEPSRPSWRTGFEASLG